MQTPFSEKQKMSAVVVIAGLTLAGFAFKAGCSGDRKTQITPRIDVPESFTAQEELLSLGTNVYFKDDKNIFGVVEQRMLNWTAHFEYFDSPVNISAKAHEKAFSLGKKIIISDGNNDALDSVEENVLKSVFSIKSYYSIKNAAGEIVAESQKMDLLGTEIVIKDDSGRAVAHMSRSAFDMGGATWKMNIDPEPGFDKRLLLFIPSFKTHADHQRASNSGYK